ncbi:MAG: shikimate dehydrogenase [Aliihoeflea sp.]
MRITGRTRIMFILAHAVDHIVGSDVLNKAFEADSLDIAVSPLSVAPEDLAAMVAMIRKLDNVAGFGVTIPHKTVVARYLDAITPQAEAIGAVNFVRRDADGRLTGHNIDGEGFIAGLRRHAVEPKGMRVLQVGAGGVGKAIAHALAADGVRSIDLVNRDHARAEQLAQAVGNRFPHVQITTWANMSDIPDRAFDLTVNATALGMREGDLLPVPARFIDQGTAVAEVVMRPPVTPLLAMAAAKGCRTIPGAAMMEPQPALVARFLGLA